MDAKQRRTRRSLLGTGVAATLALALGGLARPVTGLAKAELPPIKRDPDNEYYMRVFYDKNGRAYKVCYYNQQGTLMYCTAL